MKDSLKPLPEDTRIAFTVNRYLDVLLPATTGQLANTSLVKSLGICVYNSHRDIWYIGTTHGEDPYRTRGAVFYSNISGTRTYYSHDNIAQLSDGYFDHGSLHVLRDIFAHDRDFGSARKRPEQVDVNLLNWWLSMCEHNHSSCSAWQIKAKVKEIRLLDVYTWRLVEVDTSSCPRYCALSYVWGTITSTCLTKASIHTRLKTGYDASESLHPAVHDAVQVVKGLKERFLWVDALCIIQDSAKDKQRQIEQMGSIYSGAVLTIYAASDLSNNDLGLAGMQARTSRTRCEVIRRGNTCLVE
ncbi:hypothetical protein H2198_006276 [Neophaeococcomyces mojaviensis]|uniref:Uncharacterized protein n=1 Tax=Neophaeococcomyces mojaviensis TaxID=3383035 RepID=A0ACC3A3D7_9EURO|nr:hypothetical protein H2198_006276 [Knufia sp. JES_112]